MKFRRYIASTHLNHTSLKQLQSLSAKTDENKMSINPMTIGVFRIITRYRERGEWAEREREGKASTVMDSGAGSTVNSPRAGESFLVFPFKTLNWYLTFYWVINTLLECYSLKLHLKTLQTFIFLGVRTVSPQIYQPT